MLTADLDLGIPSGSALSYNGQPPGSPDYPDLITSAQERRGKGIGRAYVDEYNQMLTNQYNNAYNYWLWQQQMEYNKPSEQMARYLEAGLNPHYQTVDGGNASQIPSSSAQVRGNVRQNQLNAISTAVGVVSGIAGSLGKSISALSTFASTPKSIKFVRGLLTDMLGNKFEGSRFSNYLKELELAKQSKLLGVTDVQFGSIDPSSLSNEAPYWVQMFGQNSLLDARVRYQNAMTDLKEWELGTLNPLKEAQMQANIAYLLAGVGLRNLEIDWKNVKEASTILGKIMPFVGQFLFK